MTRGSVQEVHLPKGDERQRERITRRVSEMAASDSQFRAATPLPEVIETACTPGLRLTQVFETIIDGYADRPALGQRARQVVIDTATGGATLKLLPRFDTLTYRQLWDRVQAIAGAWRNDLNHLVSPGEVVVTVGFSSPDYVVVDMVCAYLGLVTVPLQHNAAVSKLRPIIEECEPAVIAVSAQYLDLAVESALASKSLRQVMAFDYHANIEEQRLSIERARARLQQTCSPIIVTTVNELVKWGSQLPAGPAYDGGSAERLAMVLYTSGSTGTPKGAMYTERMVVKTWTPGLYLPEDAAVFNVNFLPLNHLGGRLPLASAFIAGGTSYFAAESDLSTLYDDWALVRPTELVLVPRVAEMLFQHYRSAVEHRIAKNAKAADAKTSAATELRQRLGGRVLGGLVGSAPMARQTKIFVDSALDVHITEGYGLTETGIVSRDGVINRKRVLDYKLIDVPELGYFLTDRPYRRGELLIKTDALTPGYYKRPDITATVFDEDGYYRTGDVMAEIAPDRLVYVDRRTNVLKLAHGEFVAVTNLESIFAAAPLVRQIYLYGSSEQSSLLAVIVPVPEALAECGNGQPLKSSLHQSLRKAAAAAQLQSYELPVDFLIETEPFSQENGLLSGVGKQLRPRLLERYGQRLEQLYTDIAADQVDGMRALHQMAADRPVIEVLIRACRILIGAADACPTAHFADLGGDSLSALTLSNLLQEICQVDIPVGVILSPTNTLGKVAEYVETQRSTGRQRPSAATVHGADATQISASELTLDKFIDAATLGIAMTLPHSVCAPHVVLLTGANGWLGRFLTLEWLERLCQRGGKLITIVRGRDAADARKRLEAVFDGADRELLDRFHELAATHLEVLPGDIGEPELGLDGPTWQRLAHSVDLIVHPAALVNHVLPYNQLFGPNVAGTAELIRLAVTDRITPVIYMSTLGVATSVPPGRFEEDGDIRKVSPIRPINDDYANGYANSKWAGEVLLRDAHDLCGVPVMVFRSNLILAHTSYQGQLNVPDILTRLIFSLLVTGIAPQSFYERDAVGGRSRAHYDGLPVNFIANAITAISGGISRGYRSFNVSNPHDDGVSLDMFVDWLIDTGNAIKRIDDYDEWLSRFHTALSALPDRQRQNSVLPLLQAFSQPEKPSCRPAVPTAAFQAEVRAAHIGLDAEIPHITADLIDKYASDLRRLGLLT